MRPLTLDCAIFLPTSTGLQMAKEPMTETWMPGLALAALLLLFGGCSSSQGDQDAKPSFLVVSRGEDRGEDWAAEGMEYLDGRLRCVRLSFSDYDLQQEGTFFVEFKNISDSPVTRRRLRVQFSSEDDVDNLLTSEWLRIPDMDPGETSRTVVDVSDIPNVASRYYKLRVR